MTEQPSGGTPYIFVDSIHRATWQIPLEHVEYDAVVAAKQASEFARALEESYDQLIESYLEFQAYLARTTAECSIRGLSSYDVLARWGRNNNHCAFNVLNTARQFINHSKRNISELCKRLRHKKIDTITPFTTAYDRLEGYRVMEELHNAAQYAAFPLHGVSWGSNWLEDDGTKTRREIYEPQILPKMFSSSRSFKRRVLRELKRKGDTVPFLPLLKEYLSGLSGVHHHYRQELKPLLKISDTAIADLLRRGQQLTPGLERGYVRKQGPLSSYEKISQDQIALRRALVQHNLAGPAMFKFDLHV